MRIQHNIAALNSYRNLSGNNSAVSGNLEKLSSGYRINKAGDDAAGLSISEKMRSQITGLKTASANAEDGVSLVQTAEGALTEVHSMLNRMVELATQSSNGTYGEQERTKMNDEVNALKDEIDRISEGTNFNGINLLDGSMGSGTTGASAKSGTVTGMAAGAIDYNVSGNEGVTVKFATAVSGSKSAAAAWSGTTLTITLGSDTTADTFTQSDIDTAIKSASGAPKLADGLKVTLNKDIVTTTTATAANATAATATTAKAVKATADGASVTNTDGQSTAVTVTATKAGANTNSLVVSTSGDVGAAVQAGGDVNLVLDSTKEYTASDINQMLSKSGAEMTVSFKGSLTGSTIASGDKGTSDGEYVLGTDGTAGAGLSSGGGLSLQVGDTNDSFQKVTVAVDSMSATSLGLDALDISDADLAGDSIEVINKAIEKVSTSRGNLGALQNRLDHTINNLGVTTENLTAAESRIRDVDMAEEMMDFTKNNILTQAAQAMLAQANQVPQGVLQLLQ